MSKQPRRRFWTPNSISRGIDYKPGWGDLARFSEEFQHDLVEVLSRGREMGRREGIWEFSDHLRIDRETFDAEAFYCTHGFDLSPELTGELKHRSRDLLDEIATDLSLTGIMILRRD